MNTSTHSRLYRFGEPTFDQATSRDGITNEHLCRIDLPTTEIDAIALGELHTVVLSSGTCFAAGDNSKGQCGIQSSPTISWIPRLIPTNQINILLASCGDTHTMLLDRQGNLFAFGSNRSGRLGLGDCTDRSHPQRIATSTHFIHVACGSSHTLACGTINSHLEENHSSSPRCYSWGSGTRFKLGLGDEKDRHVPNEIKIPTTSPNDTGPKATQLFELASQGTSHFPATFVACGVTHSIIITNDGAIYTMGEGSDGRLGHGNENGQWHPKRIQELKGIHIKIAAASERNTICASADGNVFTFGKGNHGIVSAREAVPRMMGGNEKEGQQQHHHHTRHHHHHHHHHHHSKQLVAEISCKPMLVGELRDVGSIVTSVSAGNNGMYAVVDKNNRLFTWGGSTEHGFKGKKRPTFFPFNATEPKKGCASSTSTSTSTSTSKSKKDTATIEEELWKNNENSEQQKAAKIDDDVLSISGSSSNSDSDSNSDSGSSSSEEEDEKDSQTMVTPTAQLLKDFSANPKASKVLAASVHGNTLTVLFSCATQRTNNARNPPVNIRSLDMEIKKTRNDNQTKDWLTTVLSQAASISKENFLFTLSMDEKLEEQEEVIKTKKEMAEIEEEKKRDKSRDIIDPTKGKEQTKTEPVECILKSYDMKLNTIEAKEFAARVVADNIHTHTNTQRRRRRDIARGNIKKISLWERIKRREQRKKIQANETQRVLEKKLVDEKLNGNDDNCDGKTIIQRCTVQTPQVDVVNTSSSSLSTTSSIISKNAQRKRREDAKYKKYHGVSLSSMKLNASSFKENSLRGGEPCAILGDLGYSNRLLRTVGWNKNVSRSNLQKKTNRSNRRPVRPQSAAVRRRRRPESAGNFGRRYTPSNNARQRRIIGKQTIKKYWNDKKNKEKQELVARQLQKERKERKTQTFIEGWEDMEDMDDDNDSSRMGFHSMVVNNDVVDNAKDDNDNDTVADMYAYFKNVRLKDDAAKISFSLSNKHLGGNKNLHEMLTTTEETPGPSAYRFEKIEDEVRGRGGVSFKKVERFDDDENGIPGPARYDTTRKTRDATNIWFKKKVPSRESVRNWKRRNKYFEN